tara:strand:- start:1476 stop:1667 length:192 start_codon:yes stop_codon:yes gene_type:complete
MNAIRTTYAITLIAIFGLISTSLVNCSTSQTPRQEEIRAHATEGFERLSIEEQDKKHQIGYSQ